MEIWNDVAEQLEQLIDLKTPTVAIAFKDKPPNGVPHVESAGPASCSYWRMASEGKSFYTQASDHYNCPIGAITHGVPLPHEKEKELGTLMETMVGLEYLKPEEISSIPKRHDPFGIAVYAQLRKSNFDPDVILIRGNAKQLMLLSEAAAFAGIAGKQPAMGRPTCSVIPMSLNSGMTTVSFGCIGNRVYTDTRDDEAYFTIPGDQLTQFVNSLRAIVRANNELEAFHRSKLQAEDLRT